MPSNVIYCFPVSFPRSRYHSQSLDIFLYDLLSFMKFWGRAVTDAEALLDGPGDLVRCHRRKATWQRQQRRAVCLVRSALSQRSEGQIRFPNQSRAAGVGVFLSELVIFPFKLGIYFCVSCSLFDLLEQRSPTSDLRTLVVHEVRKLGNRCSKKTAYISEQVILFVGHLVS